MIIAHRGASAYAAENTLNAFERAIEMGASVIETDVHQTRDCVLVVMHDLTLDRTTYGNGLIKNIAYGNLKGIPIRTGKNEPAIYPPTLEETIQLINGRCQLLIEIKKGDDYYPGIEKNIVALIHKYNASSWVRTIHSFDKKALLNVARQDSNVNLQKLIVFKFPLVSFNFDKKFNKDDFKSWQGVNVYYRFCSKHVIRNIHKLGKTVYVWTVDNPRTARKLVRRGVDGIITNRPDILELK